MRRLAKFYPPRSNCYQSWHSELAMSQNELINSQMTIINRLLALQEIFRHSVFTANKDYLESLTPENMLSIVYRAIVDQALIQEKNLRVVIEGLPESLSETAIVKTIIPAPNLSSYLVPDGIFHHEYYSDSHPHPIKVHFSSVDVHNQFIGSFRRCCPKKFVIRKSVYCDSEI